MDEKILPLLNHIDAGKPGNVRFDDIRSRFDKETIDHASNLKLIEIYNKNNMRLCRLTPEGYNLILANKTRKEQNSWNKYTLFIAIVGVFIALIALSISIFHAPNGSTTITQVSSVGYTTQGTTTPTTSLYCSTQPTFVHIGNTLLCGPFSATILNATNTSVSLRATYNGISINKTVTNQRGYVGDIFSSNFSGAVVFGRVWGFSNQIKRFIFKCLLLQQY